MRRTVLLGVTSLALVTLFWTLHLNDVSPKLDLGSLDFYTQIYPMWVRAGEWMRAGAMPLWNPYQLCGQPFLASVLYGVLYPPNLVRLVAPADVAIEINIVVHLWLALALTYFYARTIGLGRTAASLAGVAYALSGCVVTEATWFTSTVAAMVWLPLGFAGLELIFRKSGRWAAYGAAALAVAVAMSMLAGWLQTWMYNLYAWSAYAAVLAATALRRRPARMRRVVVWSSIAFTLGIGLAAAQLLPSIELQALGPRRAGGLTLEQTMPMEPMPPSFFLRGAVAADPAPPTPTYLAIGVLLLLPAALLRREQRRRAVFFLAMLAVSLLVAFTVHTPFLALYRLLPGANWFRVPSRILVLYPFAAAALAGIALDTMLRSSRSRGRRALGAIVAGAAVLLIVDVSSTGRLWGSAAILALAAIALSTRRTVSRAASLVFVVVVVCDLFVRYRSFDQRPIHGLAILNRHVEVLDFIAAHQGLDRTYIAQDTDDVWALMPKQATLRQIYGVGDYEILTLDRTATFYRTLLGRFRPAAERRLQRHPFTGEVGLDAIRLPQLATMSVRFAVVGAGNPLGRALLDAGWMDVFHSRDGSEIVYENPRVLPRAYVAYSTQVAPDAETALKSMLRGGFSPWISTVLEGGDRSPPGALGSRIPIGAASIRTYQPTRVEIDAVAEAPGYLVLTDTNYPGWKAEVDGEPVEIQRANYLFRAVPLNPGSHQVTFEYDPPSFKLGVAVSLASFAALVALVVVPAWRRRQRST